MAKVFYKNQIFPSFKVHHAKIKIVDFNKKIKRLIHVESFGHNDFAVQISNRDSTYNFLLFVSKRRKVDIPTKTVG